MVLSKMFTAWPWLFFKGENTKFSYVFTVQTHFLRTELMLFSKKCLFLTVVKDNEQ